MTSGAERSRISCSWLSLKWFLEPLCFLTFVYSVLLFCVWSWPFAGRKICFLSVPLAVNGAAYTRMLLYYTEYHLSNVTIKNDNAPRPSLIHCGSAPRLQDMYTLQGRLSSRLLKNSTASLRAFIVFHGFCITSHTYKPFFNGKMCQTSPANVI